MQAAPIVNSNYLFVSTLDGHVYGLWASNGVAQWTKSYSGDITAAPANTDWTLYFGTSKGIMYVVDGVDGAVTWQFAANANIDCTPDQ